MTNTEQPWASAPWARTLFTVTWVGALLFAPAAAATPRAVTHGTASQGTVTQGGVRPAPERARPPTRQPALDVAMGFQLDLFPTVVSAVNGKVGYAPQVWMGIENVRLRLIAAHLEPPDAFTFDDRVVDPNLTAIAATIDRTFGEHFDGFWLGAGVETWLQRARAANGSGEGSWTSGVFTLGGGYIFRFAGNFTLDPWLGVHWVLNPGSVPVGDVEYTPSAAALNASVKIGWFTDIR